MVLKCSMILGCWQHLENGDGVWQIIETDIIQDWSQTQALLGCRQIFLWGFALPYLDLFFFPICNEVWIPAFVYALQMQHLFRWEKKLDLFLWPSFYSRGNRGAFGDSFFLEIRLRRDFPRAYRGKSTLGLFYTVSLRASFFMLCISVDLILLFNYSSNHLTYASFPTVNKKHK